MLHHLKWNDGKCIYSFVMISTCLLVLVLQCRKSCQVEERAKKISLKFRLHSAGFRVVV
jgi:hypothetical protein